ncbi:hypothetical protein SRS16CHR_03108 [Variovorax sp. SRS16]|uniref:DUF2889 domain-containing protein n=1 Tax=Variovorax sp. SRS16 TaxID=282217 RepID=UPI0013194F35|nr:DUF2889 domain-containing protein [Variovorax sp. SRS16]VTU22724.1 hypothetical protein SRS16CHR_03108 [Variovorax sp. SRS16]
MPLSDPAPRRAVHRRLVETQAYRRDDGLWDVEAHLRDTKAFDMQDFRRGTIPAGGPIHDMWVRVTIDTGLVVRAVESSSDAAPFVPCAARSDEFAALIGMPMASGWRRRVHEIFGGRNSCTHLVSLFEPIATTAYQALCGGDDPLGEDPLAASVHQVQKPFFVDGCRVWREDGETVAMVFPDAAWRAKASA